MYSAKWWPFCLSLNVLTFQVAVHIYVRAGLILGLYPANERRRYEVTPSLIGWAQT